MNRFNFSGLSSSYKLLITGFRIKKEKLNKFYSMSDRWEMNTSSLIVVKFELDFNRKKI